MRKTTYLDRGALVESFSPQGRRAPFPFSMRLRERASPRPRQGAMAKLHLHLHLGAPFTTMVGSMLRCILSQVSHLSSQVSSLRGQGGNLDFISFYRPGRPLRKTISLRQAFHVGSHLQKQDKGKSQSKSKIGRTNKGVWTYGGRSLKR